MTLTLPDAWLAAFLGHDPAKLKAHGRGKVDTATELMDRIDFATVEELADILSVSKIRVRQLAKDGPLQQDANGRFPRAVNIKLIVQAMHQGLVGDKKSTLDAKRTRLEKQNELLEISLQKARGDALDKREVEKVWENLVLLFRQKMLRIPSKVSPRLQFCKSEVEAEKELRQEVDEALLELSRVQDFEETA